MKEKLMTQRVAAAAAAFTDGEPGRLMKPEEAARFLGTTPKTLNMWRARGPVNLPFVKLGHSVLYDRADLVAYVEAHKRTQGEKRSRAQHKRSRRRAA